MVLRNIVLNSAAFAARVLPMPVKKALYANPAVARWVRTKLNRAAPTGLSEVTIAAGDLAGMKLYLDLQDEKDYWLGTYEPELQAAIRRFIRPGMVVYDIGANIGYITLSLARAVGPDGRVIAFEALPANLERLAINVRLNDMGSRVQIVSSAVVDRTGGVNFLRGPSIGTGKVEGSMGRSWDIHQDRLRVDSIALDDFIFVQENRSPDLIKMDIEGGEVLAIKGMIRIIREIKPIVFLELHGPDAAAASWDCLIEAGYKICKMHTGYPVVSDLADLSWKEYLVAFPKD